MILCFEISLLGSLLLIYTGIPRSVAFHFTVLSRYFILYKMKVCDNPMSSQSLSAVFQYHLLTLFLCVTFW